jgi:aconitate hydratase
METKNPFANTKVAFNTGTGEAHLYSLKKLEEMGYGDVSKLPFSIKILLEAVSERV